VTSFLLTAMSLAPVLLHSSVGPIEADATLIFTHASFRDIPLAQVARQIDVARTRFPNTPLVSVGSGRGFIEAALCELDVVVSSAVPLKRDDWIAVDPDPHTWLPVSEHNSVLMQVAGIEPSFASTDALLTAKPNLKGACILFLCWSTPNHTRFDWEAIQSLAPLACILLYDAVGGASGFLVHTWLKELGLPAQHQDKHFMERMMVPVEPTAEEKAATEASKHHYENECRNSAPAHLTPDQLKKYIEKGAEIDRDWEGRIAKLDAMMPDLQSGAPDRIPNATPEDIRRVHLSARHDYVSEVSWSIGVGSAHSRLSKPTCALVLRRDHNANNNCVRATAKHEVHGVHVPPDHTHDGCVIC